MASLNRDHSPSPLRDALERDSREAMSPSSSAPTLLSAELAQLRATLRSEADSERAQQEKRYLKSELEFIGVPKPRLDGVSGLTLREATRKLPAEQAAPLLAPTRAR